MDKNKVIVIDLGSYETRIGFAGEEKPQLSFRSLIGRKTTDFSDDDAGLEHKSHYLGDEAAELAKNYHLKLFPPYSHDGPHWKNIEMLIQHALELLGIDPKGKDLLFIYNQKYPEIEILPLIRLLYQDFKFANVFIADKATLAIHAENLENGVIASLGKKQTSISLVKDKILDKQRNLDELGDYSIDRIIANEFSGRYLKREKMEEIRNHCYIAEDVFWELERPDEEISVRCIIDDVEVSISKLRFMAAEHFFTPSLHHRAIERPLYLLHNSIAEEIALIIRGTAIDKLCILLLGAPSQIPGFEKRLKIELTSIFPHISIVIHYPANEMELVSWRGGSILASTPELQNYRLEISDNLLKQLKTIELEAKMLGIKIEDIYSSGLSIADGHISEVNVWKFNFDGELPSSLKNIPKLRLRVDEWVEERLAGRLEKMDFVEDLRLVFSENVSRDEIDVRGIESLDNLKHLKIEGGRLKQIFIDSKIIPQLEVLDLGECSFQTVSKILQTWNELPRLKVVKFGGIPKNESVAYYANYAPNLEVLGITRSKLAWISSNICQLEKLRELDLSGNQLVQLPNCLDQLDKLETLDLSHNRLHWLPEGIGNLRNLRELHLHYNHLQTLPRSITKLRKLRLLWLSNNPLEKLNDDIKLWIKEMRAEGCVVIK